MVRYGESLEKARRPGWDAAYLDYASLKSLLEEVERLHAATATISVDDCNVSTSTSKGDSLAAASGAANETSATEGLSRSPEKIILGKDNEMAALLGSSTLPGRKGHSTDTTRGANTTNSADQTNLSLSIVLEDTEENLPPSTLLNSPKNIIQFKAYEASELFLSTLRKEVEKVSLYALSRQGELADAVGALRFNADLDGRVDDLSKSSHPLFQKNLTIRHDSKSNVGGEYGSLLVEHKSSYSETFATEGDFSESEDDPMADELWFLLPSLTHSTEEHISGKGGAVANSSLLFRESLETTAPRPLFTGDAVMKTKSNTKRRKPLYAASSKSNVGHEHEEDDADEEVEMHEREAPHHCLDPFTILGVELLHLLRFICVNAMGVRKILKKYDKIIERHISNDQKQLYDKLRSDLKNILPFSTSISPDAHLQQLTNSDSIAAITSSLLRASVKTGSVSVASMEKFLIHDEALLRFKCSIDCIDILREYANVVNEPFPAFLSRQAMIVTGYDLGGIEGMKQRALEVLLTFDPDTILLMDKLELLEWQQRCWQYTFTTGGYKMRKTTFDMVEGGVGDGGPAGVPREGKALVWGGVDGSSMMINMMSTLLYTVNYYIIAPTANMYAIHLGTNGAFGSTLIGASSFAALFAALLYSLCYNKFSFKSALVFSSLCPLVGNLMYSVALSMKSMKIALIGRILVGFGSAEVVNRQLISACVHFNYMTKASAAFVVAGAAGMSVGPLLAALLVTFVAADFEEDFNVPFVGGVAFNHVSSPGFLMAALWFCQLLAVVFVFSEPDRINSSHVSSSPEKKGNARRRGAGDNQSCLSELKEVCMLVFRTPALPVTLFLFGYIEMICEVLISSCAMVSKRYFGWDGSVPGFLIASLGALVLPAHFVVERASRNYEERIIMKYSIVFIIFSIFGTINYNTMYSDGRYIENNSMAAWQKVKNITYDDWHAIQNPSSWEHLLNLTNKDWHDLQNMTLEEWSSFQNSTLKEWQADKEEAHDKWESSRQGTKDEYNALLNTTRDEWIETRQKSQKGWLHNVGNLSTAEDSHVKKKWTSNTASAEGQENNTDALIIVSNKNAANQTSNTTTKITTKRSITTGTEQLHIRTLEDEDNTVNDSTHSIHFIPHSTLLPYDWGYGYYAYLIGISAIFMGVIILEGVDTSLMCKTAHSKLNATFLNVGLLATLVGTMGRVLGDGMITLGALFGLSESVELLDFVNLLFIPLIPITLLCLHLAIKFQWSLK